MGLPFLNISIQNGGLHSVGSNQQICSGLVFYNSGYTAITGTSQGGGILAEIGSIEAAEQIGITESAFPQEHYQLQQLFTGNPSCDAFVGIFPTPTGASYTFNEVLTVQSFADGVCRRIGVVTGIALSTADVNTLQGIATQLSVLETPAMIFYSPNVLSTSYSTLPNLRLLTDSQVSVVVGQDAGGNGYAASQALGKSVSFIGLLLGYNSTNIQQNQGWIGGYNFLNGNENDSLMIGSSLYKNIPRSDLSILNDKGYIFLLKQIGVTGSYINDMPTCSTTNNNDYSFVPNNLVMMEAIRGVRTALKPFINSTVLIAKTGKLANSSVQILQNTAGLPLENMLKAGQISNYKVFIDPNQDILSNSTLAVVINVQPLGYLRYINIVISMTTTV